MSKIFDTHHFSHSDLFAWFVRGMMLGCHYPENAQFVFFCRCASKKNMLFLLLQSTCVWSCYGPFQPIRMQRDRRGKISEWCEYKSHISIDVYSVHCTHSFIWSHVGCMPRKYSNTPCTQMVYGICSVQVQNRTTHRDFVEKFKFCEGDDIWCMVDASRRSQWKSLFFFSLLCAQCAWCT